MIIDLFKRFKMVYDIFIFSKVTAFTNLLIKTVFGSHSWNNCCLKVTYTHIKILKPVIHPSDYDFDITDACSSILQRKNKEFNSNSIWLGMNHTSILPFHRFNSNAKNHRMKVKVEVLFFLFAFEFQYMFLWF